MKKIKDVWRMMRMTREERERKRMKVRGEVTTRPKYERGVFIYPNCDVGLVTLPAKQRKNFLSQ